MSNHVSLFVLDKTKLNLDAANLQIDKVQPLVSVLESLRLAAPNYDVSTGSDFLSESNALKQAAYEVEEESIADMIRNFEVGRNWNFIMGMADILKKDIPNATTNDEYSRAVGFPSFSHLVSYGRGVESAFMQGLSNDPMKLTSPELTSYYANVIANREGDGSSIIQAFESGSEFLLTPIEKQSYDIARNWQEVVINGGQLPPQAALPNEFESVVEKWDSPSTSTASTAPISSPVLSKTLQIDVKKSEPAKFLANYKPISFGNILPSSTATVQSNTARIFALLGISYALIQLVERYRRNK